MVIEPLGYIEFMSLVTEARLVITDSGGVQEETTYLGIPCLTVRDTTERPVTISEGTNRLVPIPMIERRGRDRARRAMVAQGTAAALGREYRETGRRLAEKADRP